MNYSLLYEKLIQKAKDRNFALTVCEKHHIVPKSMGGSNKKDNIVSLSPKEHYVAHHLLWKIHKNKEMHYAFWLMVTRATKYGLRDYTVTSRVYEIAKTEHSKQASILMTGRKRSAETLKKASESLKGKPAWNKGLTGIYTEESLLKMSIARTGYVESEETSKKKSESAKKRDMPANIQSKEAKEKRKLSNEQWRINNQLTCPYCSKIGVSFNMKRYHFDNCKLKEK